MKLLDCTLRDGANVVGNGFPAELTTGILKALLNCGITDIEFGNAKGMGAYDRLHSTAPLTDEEYLSLAEPYADRGELGMFLMAKCAGTEQVKLAAEHGLKFLRVGNNAGDGAASAAAVRMVKAAGLKCRYSLMKAYILSPEQLAQEAAMLEDTGADTITIMDSAGTMTPKMVAQYVDALIQTVRIPVGFHGHNNLGLSQANALIAAEHGAAELDCGLLGMARSAGNCATELLAALLQREGFLRELDLDALLTYLDTELISQMSAYGYHPAVAPLDLVLGMSGCHSSYLSLFQKIATETAVPIYTLIRKVSELDRKAPSEQFIRAVAEQYKQKTV